MANHCDNLEQFLLGDLASDDRAAFEAHLADCEACRQAVDQQRWINALIRSPERVGLETPPVELARSIATSLARHRRRRRQFAACGLAATAAALMIAAGWTVLLNRQAMPIAAKLPATAESVIASTSAEPPVAPGATFIGGDDLIVVPIESRYPNVTVVRVYRTYRPDVADQADIDEQPEEGVFFLPDEFNGG